MSDYGITVCYQSTRASFRFNDRQVVMVSGDGDLSGQSVSKVVMSELSGNQKVEDASPLLVFDAVACRESSVEYEQAAETLLVKAHLRCFFLEEGTVEVHFAFSASERKIVIRRWASSENHRWELNRDALSFIEGVRHRSDPEGETILSYEEFKTWIESNRLIPPPDRGKLVAEYKRVSRHSMPFVGSLLRSSEGTPPKWAFKHPRVAMIFDKRAGDHGDYYQVGFRMSAAELSEKAVSLAAFDLGSDSHFSIGDNGLSFVQVPVRRAAAEAASCAGTDWLVEVSGLPERGVAGPWNALYGRYVEATRWVGGRRALSWLPDLEAVSETDDLSGDESCWGALYQIKDELTECRNSDDFQVRCVAVYPQSEGSLRGSLPLILNHRNEPLACRFRFAPVRLEDRGGEERKECTERILPPNADPPGELDRIHLMADHPGILLALRGPVQVVGVDKDAKRVRIGALDLLFEEREGDRAEADYVYFCFDTRRGKTGEKTDIRAGLHAKMRLPVALACPGGQDDVAGDWEEACLDVAGEKVSDQEDCRRTPPLVIAAPEDPAPEDPAPEDPAPEDPAPEDTKPETSRLFLGVAEHHDVEENHRIDLKLTNEVRGGRRSHTQKVIVIDREPFFVGQLEFPSFHALGTAEGNEIANWRNYGPDPDTWRMRTDGRPFEFSLPSPAVGEEMERYKSDREGREKEPLDFRLSPPAVATLQTTYFRQSFPEPPWNLRRILGFSGREMPGAVMRRLDYEILYGLSCSVGYPLLRLAEIEAVVGTPPRALPRQPTWLPESEKCPQLTPSVQEAWARHRDAWWALLKRLRSRLAVFEAWDEASRDTIAVKDDVKCFLRIPKARRGRLPAADMRGPFEDDPQGKKLAGGATWGFESVNVYEAVLRDPHSNTADVADLFLSSLGAWGKQKATFDEKRTAIYADASMGRAYSYRLERIGRIAVWWNRAKHVIIYRRTVAPSEQFACDQNGFYGWPVLRKVEEYVEILEERREFPDGDDQGSASARQERGFVEASVFEKGARFPVRSDWGTEVRKDGWKVPIWRPGMEPRELYVKPTVQLSLTGHVDGERRPEPRTIDDPENLFFYTDTRKGTGEDPDKWPAVEDVDYVDLPRPRPAEDFATGRMIRTTPEEFAVPTGFTPCTFRLQPSANPVDLVAERGLEPMAAHLETVTLARASSVGSNAAKAPPASAEWLPKLIADGVSEWLQRLPDEDEDVTREVRGKLDELYQRGDNKLRQALDRAQKLKGQLAEARKQVYGPDPTQIHERFQDAEDQLHHRFTEQLAKIEEDLEKRLGAGLVQTIKDLADPKACRQNAGRFKEHLKEEARRRIRTEVARALAHARDEIDRRRYTPGVAVQALRPGLDAVVGEVTVAAARVGELRSRLLLYQENYQDLGREEVKYVAGELATIQAMAGRMEETVRKAAARRPWSRLPDPTPALTALEAVRNLPKADALEQSRKDLLDAGKLERDLWERLTGDLARLEEELHKGAAAVRDVGKGLDDLVRDFDTERDRRLDEVEKAVEDEVRTLVEGLLDNIDDALPVADVCTAVERFADGVRGEAEKKLREAWKGDDGLEKVYAKAKSLSANALQKVGEWTRPAEDALGSAIQDLEGLMDGIADQGTGLREELEKKRDELLRRVDENFADIRLAVREVREGAEEAQELYATGQRSLRVIRAFGKPPEVTGLKFDDPAVGFFFEEASRKVGITPIIGRAAQISEAVESLKPLGVDLPTLHLDEKLLPASLKNFDLSKILPNFGGLDLGDLFQGVKMPEVSDAADVQHGFDRQTRTAWLKATIDVKLRDRQPVFSTGPLALWLNGAEFSGRVRAEAGEGLKVRRSATGSIYGDWELVIGGTRLVTIKETELFFDESGELLFKIDPSKIEMPEALSFITELVKSFLSSLEESGVKVTLLADGVEAAMALPIPDLQGATFGISGMTLFAALQLRVVAGKGFAIGLDFALARKDLPFTLTIFILGGSGYIDAQTLYFPKDGSLVTEVSLALMASASLAISLGPVSGGVFVYFGVTAHFASGGARRGLAIGIVFMIRGHVSVLSIASASIVLRLEAQYSDGSLVGRGSISIRIKICWCFTLKVNESVTYTLAGGGGGGGNEGVSRRPRPVTRLASAAGPLAADLPPRLSEPFAPRGNTRRIRRGVGDWLNMLD